MSPLGGQLTLWWLLGSKSGFSLFGSLWYAIKNCHFIASTAEKQRFSACLHHLGVLLSHTGAAGLHSASPHTTWLTTHPVESSFRSAMQRKLRLQPPLSLVQSLTGPKESRRTSRESKDELIINSSLLNQQTGRETQLWGCVVLRKAVVELCLHVDSAKWR